MLAANTNIAHKAQHQSLQSPLELLNYSLELPTLTKQSSFHKAFLIQRWQPDAPLAIIVRLVLLPQLVARKERTAVTRMEKI